MRKNLRETVTEAPVKKGNRWRVIVAKPGVGSSGTYSEELFRRDASKIIAPGGQAFINHEEDRNPKDMLGTYPEGSYWSEEDKAVVSELEVFSHWKAFVEEVGPHCGISLYALGEADEEGNITAIVEDALNGADLVARPGLIGSGLAEKLYESAVAGSDHKPSVEKASAQESNGKDVESMAIEELTAQVEVLTKSVEALVSAQQAKVEETVQIEADEKAVSEALDAFEATLKLIDDADLLPSQVESLRAEAKAGKDVAPLIEAAKSVKAEAEAAIEGRLTESGTAGRVVTTKTVESATDLGKVFG